MVKEPPSPSQKENQTSEQTKPKQNEAQENQ